MSARDSAEYQEITLESSDGSQSIDIRLGVVDFSYYEDLFSPTLTAKMTVVNTGGSASGSDGKYESLYSGLKLSGGERISIRVRPNGKNPLLDFSSTPNDYLYVSSINNIIREGQRELFVLDIVSREALTNETTRVPIKFPSSLRISDSVSKIVKEYLKSEVEVDETTNKYGFIGNLKRPFNLLVWLASKAVPNNGIAGFFFYQTKSGFKFKSVDNLISTAPKATYTYYEAPKSPIETDDFKILSYSIEKNNDLLKKMRFGTYSSFFAEFNPYTGLFTRPENSQFDISSYTDQTKNLGDDVRIPGALTDSGVVSFSSLPSRIISRVADIGTVESGVSIEQNASGNENERQKLFRYNLLFMQQLSMTVPVNTNLEVGDVIKCNFPRISANKEYDREQSGLYMIKELCHNFNTEQSLTSMKLVRDTYGEFPNT